MNSSDLRHDPFPPSVVVRARSVKSFFQTLLPTLRFWMETEVHVYSFSIAANVLLSFFPFVMVMFVLCQSVFHWPAAVEAIKWTVNDYFPENFGIPFGQRLEQSARLHRGLSLLSLLFLFFTANGIFEPLEVALNRIWKIRVNRSYLKNQLVSFGLIFACGALVLCSTSITALNREFLEAMLGTGRTGAFATLFIFKLFAMPMTMLMLFLIYWLLPNGHVPARRLVPASILVGILLEVLKYINLLTWPWLKSKLEREVGPFVHSSAIVLWAFFAAMLILAGAEWSARVVVGDQKAEPATGPA